MPLHTPPPTLPHTRANSNAPKSCDEFINFDTICVTNRLSADRENPDYDRSPNSRSDKRRRVHSRSSRTGAGDSSAGPSPVKHTMHQSYPHPSRSPDPHPVRRMPNLAPIKPIGFAASRESRREDGADHPIPSPVVMGFDFKQIDEDQLKTVGFASSYDQVNQAEAVRLQVRDTISIREQQQALIAQRRKDVVASTPATPKELTFKGWQPKDPDRLSSTGPLSSGGGSGGVGKRREKTRDKVEGMTINTGMHDKEGVLGSKVSQTRGCNCLPQSAPMGQGLAAQQQAAMSGSQTAIPPTILPPLTGYSHLDPRTAPISHTRTRNGDERERDPRDPREHEYSRGQFWRPLPRPTGYENVPHTARPTISIPSSDRRNFSGPSMHPSHRDRQLSGGHPGRNGQYSLSPSPPHGGSRDAFPQPSNSIYDLMHQADQLRYSLQDLLHRYEGAYSSQINAMGEFKNTATQASTLLGTLQASADSLKDMVRYEVNRAGSTERREVDELKDRIKKLEERLETSAAGEKGN